MTNVSSAHVEQVIGIYGTFYFVLVKFVCIDMLQVRYADKNVSLTNISAMRKVLLVQFIFLHISISIPINQ